MNYSKYIINFLIVILFFSLVHTIFITQVKNDIIKEAMSSEEMTCTGLVFQNSAKLATIEEKLKDLEGPGGDKPRNFEKVESYIRDLKRKSTAC